MSGVKALPDQRLADGLRRLIPSNSIYVTDRFYLRD
jgi:hypothetical protein